MDLSPIGELRALPTFVVMQLARLGSNSAMTLRTPNNLSFLTMATVDRERKHRCYRAEPAAEAMHKAASISPLSQVVNPPNPVFVNSSGAVG